MILAVAHWVLILVCWSVWFSCSCLRPECFLKRIRPSVVWELPNSWLLLSFRHLIRPCVSMSTMANRILDFMTNAIALLNWHLILTCPLNLQYHSKSVETYWLFKIRLYFYFTTLIVQSDLTEHRCVLRTIHSHYCINSIITPDRKSVV